MQIPVGAPPSRTGTLNRTSAHMRLPTVETAANPTPIRNGLPPPQPSQQGHANVVALHAAAMVAAAPQLIPPPIAGNADGRPRSPNNAAAQQLPPILSLHRVGNNSTPPPPGAGGNRSTPPPTAAATTTTTTRGFRRATATIATLLEPTPAQPERAATIAVLSPLPSDPLAAAAVVVTSRNVCSFVAGGHGLVRQRVFRCEQCQVECCASCAATCHAGHSAAFTKSAAFYCPCGATTSCKALSTESAKVLAAARDNVCTVTRTGREYVKQVYYRCLTCNLVGNLGCCAVCVSVCHAGHQLELPAANLENSGTFFCDCGIGAGTGKCRALTSNRVDENPDQYLQFALGDDPRSLVLFSNVDGRLDLEAYVKLFFKERPSTVRPAKFVLIDGTSHAWPLDTDVSALPKTVKARTLKIYGVPDEDELDLDL